jgi:hypothetical protein
MFRNSAKLRFADGVLRPKPGNGAPPPPGVDIIEEGRGVDLGGGVDGAGISVLDDPPRAGEGEVAKCMSRLASASPLCPSRVAPVTVKPLCRRRAERATAGGGVRGARGGGEDRTCELFIWKEVMGRSSSSSEINGDLGSSGMVEVSDTKDKLGAWVAPNLVCRRWYAGEDWGSRCMLFQAADEADDALTLVRL